MSRAAQTERNRQLVLEAARQVFLTQGYHGARLDAIAEEAGFSKGVVYSQFAGKADLFVALLEHRIAERAAGTAQFDLEVVVDLLTRLVEPAPPTMEAR